MLKSCRNNPAGWLCLVTFLAAGPLEGDEIPKLAAGGHVTTNAVSASLGPPASSASPTLLGQKDPTIDAGFVKRLTLDTSPDVMLSLALPTPGPQDGSEQSEWLSRPAPFITDASPPLRTTVLLL